MGPDYRVENSNKSQSPVARRLVQQVVAGQHRPMDKV